MPAGRQDATQLHSALYFPKKAVKPAQQKPLVEFVRVGFGTSEGRACRVIGYHRSAYRYRSRAKDQPALRMRLRELASVRVRYG